MPNPHTATQTGLAQPNLKDHVECAVLYRANKELP